MLCDLAPPLFLSVTLNSHKYKSQVSVRVVRGNVQFQRPETYSMF